MTDSFSGLMCESGFKADDTSRWKEAKRRYFGRRVTVRIEPEKQTRSHRQNAWYWGVIVPAVAEHLSIDRVLPLSADQCHEVLKAAFIGVEETELGTVPKSSAALTTEEFSTFCELVRAHAASEWGMQIPNPGEGAV